MDLYLEERKLRSQGFQFIAGVDEVGRGCLAGPVFAAAVILPKDFSHPELRDSKKLTPRQREKLNTVILENAVAVNVGQVEVDEIDRINIFQASLKAMGLAVQQLSQQPQLLLVDGKFPIHMDLPQKTYIKGDGRCAAIAAASIVAKVARDRLMVQQEGRFPAFSFAKHKGYGTAQHLRELAEHGPTVLHRRSFAPVREKIGALSSS